MRGVVPGLENPLTIDESKRTDACVITLQTEDRVIREPKDVPQKHAKDPSMGDDNDCLTGVTLAYLIQETGQPLFNLKAAFTPAGKGVPRSHPRNLGENLSMLHPSIGFQLALEQTRVPLAQPFVVNYGKVACARDDH